MPFTRTFKDGSTPSIAIIGAGLSGICAAIQLQRLLHITTFVVYELEADLGGTWLSNTYPGCQSDAHSHLYSYSFAPNYDFSKKFIPQSEVFAYLKSTAKSFNVYEKIRFQTQVTNMQWHEGRNKWILHWKNRATGVEGDQEVDFVIHGAGLLRHPNIPAEFDAFEGKKLHSARWDHSVDLTGKRVGVVGASASGVQIVSAIADKVESLDVYARSPVYITPQFNITYNFIWRFFFRYVPFFYKAYRFSWYYSVDSNILLYHKLSWFSAFHRATVYGVTWLHRFLQLPFNRDLRRKATPDYEIASRRIVLSDTYYPTLKKPNVTLHRDPIRTVSSKTIETEDGSKSELDVLVLATGFEWAPNIPPKYWTGRGGVDIATSWGESPNTYYAHHALTSTVEVQVMYTINSISYMMEHDIATMEVKQDAVDEFLKTLDRRMERTIFTTEYKPKFLNSQGKCRGFWWGSVTEFWWHLKDLHPERFDVKRREETSTKSIANGTSTPLEKEPIKE
ncbi:hypothetical protein BGX31_003454 [Mortierella sp. GBA43]|nr:hypothetical protein BGX31_003454 [Mortierella sp. GBA43]